MAHEMMVHRATNWPKGGSDDPCLWKFDAKNVVWLYNCIPDWISGLSLLIAGIHYAPISYDYQLHQPIKHTIVEDPYENLEISLHNIGSSETGIIPVIAGFVN